MRKVNNQSRFRVRQLLRLSILGLLCMPLLLCGQQPVLSIDQAIQRSLQENQNIQLQRLEDEAAAIRDNWGQAGFLPSLSAQGGYTYSVNDITQQIGVANDSAGPNPPSTIDDAVAETYEASATLGYVLFDGFGRINNLRKLGLQKDLSETQLRFSIENTILSLFNSYYNAARLYEQQEVDLEAIRLSYDRYQRADAAYELGSGSRIEMLSALVDLRTDSVNYLTTTKDFGRARRSLNQLLKFPIDSVYVIDTTLSINKELSYAPLLQQATESNAALVQAQFNREISKKEIGIARSEYLPELSANLGYNYNRQENEGSFLQFSESEGWQGGISLRWNIFNGYRTATQVELAKIRLDQSELEVSQAQQQLQVDLGNAYSEYQNSLEILAIEQRNLKVARLNYERSLEAYKLGQLNNTQLREAQLNYTRSQTRLRNLRYSGKLAEIELLRVAGILLEDR